MKDGLRRKNQTVGSSLNDNTTKTILHVHPYLKALNGSERLLIEMVRAWPFKDTHRIATVGQSFELPADLNMPVSITWSAPPPESRRAILRSYLALPFVTLRGKADVTIAHSGAAIFPAAVRRFIRGGKLIYLCHEPPRFLYDLLSFTLSRRGIVDRFLIRLSAPFLRAVDRWSVSQADASFVLSQYSAEQFKDIYGKEPLVAAGAADFDKFYRQVKVRPKPGYIISVSKIHARKNIELLLAALSTAKLSAFKAVIVGKGPHEAELHRIANQLKLNDRVEWLGGVSDERLQRAYDEASVFVFCAYNEPFGLVVLEAMSMGIPVAVPNEGGPQEIVGDGKYGAVFEQDNKDSLSEAIIRASKVNTSFITKAQAHARSFSWANYASAIAQETRD